MVFLFRDEEMDGFLNGRHDGVVVDVAHVGNRRLGGHPLVLGEWHDAGTVLRANVVALTVELGRVVDGKEHLKEGLKRDNGGVKLNLDHFSVAGCAAANGFVSRVRVVAPSVGR